MAKEVDKNTIFLSKILTKIKKGDYDQYLTFPGMNKDLLYVAIKSKFFNKVDSGGTPILTDAEIEDAIKQARETAVEMNAVFIKNKILVKGIDGYELSDVAKRVLKTL